MEELYMCGSQDHIFWKILTLHSNAFHLKGPMKSTLPDKVENTYSSYIWDCCLVSYNRENTISHFLT